MTANKQRKYDLLVFHFCLPISSRQFVRSSSMFYRTISKFSGDFWYSRVFRQLYTSESRQTSPMMNTFKIYSSNLIFPVKGVKHPIENDITNIIHDNHLLQK